MEIAVFSDIHGNYEAFKQCVDLVLGRGIRTFIFLGDYSGEFPYPQKTMGLLYALKEAYTCFFVRGTRRTTGLTGNIILPASGRTGI